LQNEIAKLERYTLLNEEICEKLEEERSEKDRLASEAERLRGVNEEFIQQIRGL
jgi:hypothetical protein